MMVFKRKKIFTAVLAVCMLLACFNLSTMAAEEIDLPGEEFIQESENMEVSQSQDHESEDIDSETDENFYSLLTTRAAGDITITFNGEARENYTTVFVNDTRDLQVEVEGMVIQSVQWSSSNTNILTVSGDKDGAILEAKSIGVATITANITTLSGTFTKDIMISTRTPLNLNGYANVNVDMHRAANETSAVSKNINKNDILEVRGENGNYYWVYYENESGFVLKNKVNITADDLTLNANYLAVKKNGQGVLQAAVIPDQYTGTVTWNSNAVNVASVSNNGTVKGVNEGVARITASAEGIGGNIQAECFVSIWTGVTEAKASTSSAADGKKAAFSSSENTGSIAAGEAVTVVGQCLGYYYVRLQNGEMTFIDKNKLVIPVTGISLNEKMTEIGIGQSEQLGATIFPETATDKRVTWKTNNSAIATVDSNGKITGVKIGVTYVEARDSSGKFVAECRVEVQKDHVYKTPLVDAVRVFNVNSEHYGVSFFVQVDSQIDFNVKYEINLYNKKGVRQMEKESGTMPSNRSEGYAILDLDYNTEYYITMKVTYQENGKTKTKETGKIKFTTKKPEISLRAVNSVKSNLKIEMTADPSPKTISKVSYRVRYKAKNAKSFSKLSAKEFSRKGETFTIKKALPAGKKYTFEIALIKKNEVVCKNTVDVNMGYTNVKVSTDKNLSKITVKWDKVKSVDGYEIYRSLKKGKLGDKIKTIKKADTTSYTDATKSLKNGKTYYYQVRPYWTKDKKKITGSSNQPGILCRKINTATNKKVLLKKMGLQKLIASGSKVNMNQFRLNRTNQLNSSVYTYPSQDPYPAVKYQFDGKKLYIHLYIEYSSYTFKGTFLEDGTPECTAESPYAVHRKGLEDGYDASYVSYFEKGLKEYYNNQLVKGTKRNFGTKVNFKTKLVLHRKDNSKESYHKDQKFIEVMIGGIDKYYYTKSIFLKDSNPYWYHVSPASQKIYIPEDEQLELNSGKHYKTPILEYILLSAHEMGHILGLSDAHYDDVTGTGCFVNYKGKKTDETIMYFNGWKLSEDRLTASDFYEMLRVYKNN